MTNRTETGVRMAARAALLGGTALAVVLSAGGPARAQTGAELQSKIEALESENRMMKEQLRQVQEQIDTVAKTAPQKPVKMVSSGNEDVSLKISGQVNRAVLIGDDGQTGFISHVDNDSSSTRIRFDGAAKVDDDLTVKSRVEVQLEINSSASDPGGVGLQTNTGGAGGFGARKAYIAFNSKTFGELTLGQESVATDGINEADLSGTSVILNSEAEDFAGGVSFSNSANGVNTGININASFDNFDGAGGNADRMSVVRYESPKFVGFQLIGSHGVEPGSDDESIDVALRYGGKFWDTKVEAAVGYANGDQSRAGSTVDQNYVGGSVGLLHEPTGLNVHYSQGKVAFTGNNDNTPGPSFWYVKGGWQGKIWSMGKTAVSIDYGQYVDDDGIAVGGRHDNFGQAYGIGLVQKIDKAATELYAGVRRYELDVNAGATDPTGAPITGLDPVLAAMIGARVKF